MKKAVVVGGSNGIGLAIVNSLTDREYFVYILDVKAPEPSLLSLGSRTQHIYCDLLAYDEQIFEELCKDTDIDLLMITAGFGRVADFEYLHISEIHNLLMVNTVAGIKIIRNFYDRIKSAAPFYTGMMGSIAGLVSSPMFSVYAASKAGICRFIESVNIELETGGFQNRILNVSPGSIKGTRFNGGDNDMSKTHELAESIVDALFDRKELLIPEYKEIYKGVLERYRTDAHLFGISSYNYKKASGRAFSESRIKIGYYICESEESGGKLMKKIADMKKQCDYLIVHANKVSPDQKAILQNCRLVDRIDESDDLQSAKSRWGYHILFTDS